MVESGALPARPVKRDHMVTLVICGVKFYWFQENSKQPILYVFCISFSLKDVVDVLMNDKDDPTHSAFFFFMMFNFVIFIESVCMAALMILHF